MRATKLTIKLFLLLIFTASILFVPVITKAAENYIFKTDGSYKWVIEGGNLTNYVDVYDKTTNQKITTLKIYYEHVGDGALYESTYGTISNTKLGDYSSYALNSTSDSRFTIPTGYGGIYHILTEPYQGPVYVKTVPNAVQIYPKILYTADRTGDFSGYLFKSSRGTDVYLKEASPKTDNWYGVYLNDTMVSIKNGGQPVTPITPGTSPGSGTTAGQEGGCAGEIPNCATPNPFQPPLGIGTGDRDQSLSETLKQSNITTAWGLTLDLINVIAIFILLAIAFANILHLGERDEYNFKRMIPALVIGLILANFSHLLCRAIIDFAAMLMNFFVPKNDTMNFAYNLVLGMWSGFIQAPEWGAMAATIGGGITYIVSFMFMGAGCAVMVVAVILLLVPVIIMAILFFLLAVRIYVIWFLVIISPIAFFLIMFSSFQKQIQWWWTLFFQWVFMGPIVYFMIYIAEGFARGNMFTAPTGGLQCFDLTNGSQVDGLTKYLFVNALLILAIVLSFIVGGKIMAGWAGFGKFMGGLGAYAGTGIGAAGLRRIGHKAGIKGLKNIQNPLTLPALPRGWENSPAGMLWENKRKADTENLSKNLKAGMTSGRIFGRLGWGDNTIKEDMSKFNDTSGWSAEGLVNHMNDGVKETNRLKMARGVRGLSIMAKDGRRIDEQKAAQRALDALGVTSDEVGSPEDVGKLVSVARNSGGFEMNEKDKKIDLNRDPRTHIPQNFKAKKQVAPSDDLRKIGGTNEVEREPLPPRDKKEPNHIPRPMPTYEHKAEEPGGTTPPGGAPPGGTPPEVPPEIPPVA